jgi:serine/threonine-protein kinase ULK/ATG1
MEITILDRYKFIPQQAVGYGSFSKVYLGLDTITNEKVAIKKMELGNFSPQMRCRVQEEVTIALKLSHKNIVKTYDVVFEDSDVGPIVYIIMEHCECGDFSRFLINEKMKESRAKFFFNQLLEGLKYLQEQNIIHRDLKPANLLLTDNKKVLKIADFGFARHLGEGRMSETMCGSPLYMAPEVLFGEPYTSKADLWSIGVILYQALYGKHPFQANNHTNLIKMIRSCNIELPKNVHLTPDCLNLLLGLLTKNPNNRLSWEDFFAHPWLKHLQMDKRIDQLRDSMEPGYKIDSSPRQKSEPISIGGQKQCPISLSVSPMSFETLMNSYCSPSSSSSLEGDNLNVVQSDIVIADKRNNEKELIVRIEKPKENKEGYLTYAWSVISSSMKPLSVFRQ